MYVSELGILDSGYGHGGWLQDVAFRGFALICYSVIALRTAEEIAVIPYNSIN
jgi:hypothetical protein